MRCASAIWRQTRMIAAALRGAPAGAALSPPDRVRRCAVRARRAGAAAGRRAAVVLRRRGDRRRRRPARGERPGARSRRSGARSARCPRRSARRPRQRSRGSCAPRPPLTLGERVVRLDQPQVMAILNMTPDSFSDGGRFETDPDGAAGGGDRDGGGGRGDHRCRRRIDPAARADGVGGRRDRPHRCR